MTNRKKRKNKILKILSRDIVYSLSEIHVATNIAKQSISNDLLELIADRHVIQIKSEPVNGYKLR